MGKAAIFAVLAFVAMGAFYSMSTQQSMLQADESVADQQREVLVKNAALVGYEAAKRELTENFAVPSPQIKGTYEGASYEVTVLVSGDDATIRSVGTMDGDGEYADAKVTILARVTQEDQSMYSHDIKTDPPAFMTYALISQNDLQLNGNVLVEGELDAEGNEGSRLNANIHTNGAMSADGASASVRGFGTYVTSETVQHEDKIFDPYNNQSEAAHLSQVEAVDIPYASFDTQEIASHMVTDPASLDFASHIDGSGNVTLSAGNYNFDTDYGATREDPYIWHVQGNLEVTGDVTMSGYVMFLVDGDMQFGGNVESGGNEGTSESHMAFYAMGEDNGSLLGDSKTVDVAGNVNILSGQIFSKGNLEFHGTPQLIGTVTVGGTATISGAPDIVYAKASPALTYFWQNELETTTKLRLYGYQVIEG